MKNKNKSIFNHKSVLKPKKIKKPTLPIDNNKIQQEVD